MNNSIVILFMFVYMDKTEDEEIYENRNNLKVNGSKEKCFLKIS